MKKNARRNGIQRYKCNDCGYQFQSPRRQTRALNALWHRYAHQKQTLPELAAQTGHSHVWVRRRLDAVPSPHASLVPQPTVVIPDTTFWGRQYGVTVFRSWNLKRNIWWSEVTGERQATYYYGRKILEAAGWVFTAAVVDGRRGLATVFKDILVQVCHFHQMKTVTKYLTRRPETEAGQELRSIVLTLPHTDRTTFTRALTAWEKRWHTFITEKTHLLGTNRWYYTHKNVRGAFLSVHRNLPYLFTYLEHPELNIPNTTNSLDGFFSSLKRKVAAHRGLRRDRRYKLISELLNS